MYAVHISDLVEGKGPSLEDCNVLQKYADVFLDEILGLTLKRDIDFTIYIMIGVAPLSKVTY